MLTTEQKVEVELIVRRVMQDTADDFTEAQQQKIVEICRAVCIEAVNGAMKDMANQFSSIMSAGLEKTEEAIKKTVVAGTFVAAASAMNKK